MGQGQVPVPELLIFPCNGNGLEALGCLGDDFGFAGFVDDTPAKRQSGAYGHRVLGREALLDERKRVLAVPGGPKSFQDRQRIIEGLGVVESRFATVVHPGAHVSPLARIGHNVLIMAGVVVTSNAIIGNHVCILPNTVIHHDVVIGDWTLVGSNVTLAGSCQLGAACYIGSGTSVMNGIRIGAGALVGLGGNVIRDVAAGDRVAGNPVRSLLRNS